MLYLKFQIYGIPKLKVFQYSKLVVWDPEREGKLHSKMNTVLIAIFLSSVNNYK